MAARPAIMEKRWKPIIGVIIIIGLVGFTWSLLRHPSKGGDVDEHGCLGSAGYVWCLKEQRCLRPGEQECSILLEKDPRQK